MGPTAGWGGEFDSPPPAELGEWNVFNQPDYSSDGALCTRGALEVVDRQLVITAQRHCVDEDIDQHDPANHDELTGRNASAAPCADDEYEKFTSGRLQSPDIARGEFGISVTASIGTGGVRGVRSAIWLQNESAACSVDPTQTYGELDLVGHFFHDARAVCSASNVQGQVVYFFDDRPTDRESWRHGTTSGHVQVETADWTHPASPDEDFPVCTMTVDRPEVRGTPFADPAPAPNPVERLPFFSW